MASTHGTRCRKLALLAATGSSCNRLTRITRCSFMKPFYTQTRLTFPIPLGNRADPSKLKNKTSAQHNTYLLCDSAFNTRHSFGSIFTPFEIVRANMKVYKSKQTLSIRDKNCTVLYASTVSGTNDQ